MAGSRVVFTTTLGELAEIPGSPCAYWASQSLRRLFKEYPPLDRDVAGMPEKPKIADVKQGLATADDLRFTRFWWEVPVDRIGTSREETLQGKRWVPFAKGGKPFYHDISVVVNWEKDGAEIKNFDRAVVRNESFYFREGLAWALIESSVRMDVFFVAKGCIYSHAAHAIFLDEKDGQYLPLEVALNSSLYAFLFHTLDPLSHNREGGKVAKFPIDNTALNNKIPKFLARQAYGLLREWDTGNEPSTHFVVPWILQVWQGFDPAAVPVTGHPLAKEFAWSDWPMARELRGEGRGSWQGPASLATLAEEAMRREGALRRRLQDIQREIDEEVYRIYQISDEDRALIEEELAQETADETTDEVTESQDEDETSEAAGAGAVTLDTAEHIRRLIHYFAHQALARDTDGIVPLTDLWLPDGAKEPGLSTRVREALAATFGPHNLGALEEEITRVLGKPLAQWLAEDFFGYHMSLFRLRPIIWQLSSQGLTSRRARRSEPVFSCFIYWHRLDTDTLYKVQQFYLQPFLAAAEKEVERLSEEVARSQGEAAQVRRRREEAYQAALDRRIELSAFGESLSRLLSPHGPLRVESRSQWVKDKVNQLVQNGYRPERDWGVRVNIEPLKQAKLADGQKC